MNDLSPKRQDKFRAYRARKKAAGLREIRMFQTDKLAVVQRVKCRQMLGRLDDASMAEISTRLAIVLGLAE